MTSEPALRRIALLVEYDGTDFAGSQAQTNGRAVQDVLETALAAFTGERQRLRFAGRTDAGVHARGQVVTLDTSTAHASSAFRSALNRFLPADVAVRAACEVTPTFDARRDSLWRRYRYQIVHGQVRSPLARRTTWQIQQPLDAGCMSEAASLLPTGMQRNWSAFAGPLTPDRSPLRTLRACQVVRCSSHRIEVTMEAESFLPHQVRRTVGALRDVGLGRRSVQDFAGLLNGSPASAGPVAPPQGLTLTLVRYAQGLVEWDDDEDVSAA